MRTAIDKSGRLVLPKAARDRLGIRAGDVLELEPTADGLRMTVVQDSRRLVKDGRVLVAGGTLARPAADTVGEHRDQRIAELVRQAIS